MDPWEVPDEWAPEPTESEEKPKLAPVEGKQLPHGGKEQLEHLIQEYKDVVTEVLGCASGIWH